MEPFQLFRLSVSVTLFFIYLSNLARISHAKTDEIDVEIRHFTNVNRGVCL